MRLRRKSRLLNDAIEALDQRLIQAKDDPLRAFSLLTPIELEFVKGELDQCITSRIYYLENYHCILPETGTPSTLWPIWDLQYLIEEAIVKEKDRTGQAKVIVLKPRQSGGTEYSTGVMCHATFFTPNAFSLVVAQNPEVAGHVQRKINTSWDFLPWWLRPERQYHSKGEYLEFQRKDQISRQANPGLGSVFVTTHAQRESGVAIGRTVRFFHGTEVSRWASGEIYTADIEPSMNAPDTLGILESASWSDSGFFRNMWDEAVESSDPEWIPVFLPVYRAKKFSLPLKIGQKFVLTVEEQSSKERALREEGFRIDDSFFNWRRRRVQAAIKRNGDPYSHYAAYPMTAKEAFQSTGTMAFPRHKLDFQEQTFVRNPIWHGAVVFQGMHSPGRLIGEEVKPGQYLQKRILENNLWIWEFPKPGSETYYIGADVSTGQAFDFSGAPVWRVGKGGSPDVQVAEWHGKIAPTDFAKVLYGLGYLYNQAELAVEYNGPGVTTGDYLFVNLEYPKLYRPRRLDKIGNQMASYVHWITTHKTKTRIVTRMQECLLDNSIIIRSQVLLDELRKFRISSISVQGQISYSGLEYPDDDLMGALIGLFCLRETLEEFRSPTYADDASRNSPTRGARPSGGGFVYGVYDQWTRMMAQCSTESEAQKKILGHPGWVIRPIPISRVNTAYSVIHHGRGAENELWRQGVDQKEITPGLAYQYRMAHEGARAMEESDADDLNQVLAGQEWESAELE